MNVRRFVKASLIGGLAVAIPYVWVLTVLWNGGPTLLRTVLPNDSLSNFYDLQARALLHGHLYVANGALGSEAFIHDGHQFTYFGIFPSLLRIPLLLVTSRLDGRLTALSILIAWIVTGVFSCLLLWRVRWLLRGAEILGRAEAAAYAVMVAAVLGGTILVDLAANPWVYSEDIAWSVALTVGALFTLTSLLEQPSRLRVIAAMLLISGAMLTRGSTGYGCVIGAVLAALWLAFRPQPDDSLGKRSDRRWSLAVLAAGLVPLVLGSVFSYAKFGIPYGYPLHDQIYFNTQGLSHIKGYYFGLRFIPSTVVAYLASSGVHLSTVFPFVSLPLFAAHPIGGVVLYGSEEVTSLPGSSPLLLLVAIWGLAIPFWRRWRRPRIVLAIPLLAAAAPAVAILLFGFIDNRFLGDFVPLLVLAGSIGMVDVWRRLETTSKQIRFSALAAISALGLYSVVANVAMASSPTGWWSRTQALNFVRAQSDVSRLTGHPLSSRVVTGTALPRNAPSGELFIAGDCAALFLRPATGFQNWLELETEPPYRHVFDITVSRPIAEARPMMSIGPHDDTYTLGLDTQANSRSLRFFVGHGSGIVYSKPLSFTRGLTQQFTIETDLAARWYSITTATGSVLLQGPLDTEGPITVHAAAVQTSGQAGTEPITVADRSNGLSSDSLCRTIRSSS